MLSFPVKNGLMRVKPTMKNLIRYNVVKAIINHAPVITMFISGMVTIPCHGWFMALFYPHCMGQIFPMALRCLCEAPRTPRAVWEKPRLDGRVFSHRWYHQTWEKPDQWRSVAGKNWFIAGRNRSMQKSIKYGWCSIAMFEYRVLLSIPPTKKCIHYFYRQELLKKVANLWDSTSWSMWEKIRPGWLQCVVPRRSTYTMIYDAQWLNVLFLQWLIMIPLLH